VIRAGFQLIVQSLAPYYEFRDMRIIRAMRYGLPAALALTLLSGCGDDAEDEDNGADVPAACRESCPIQASLQCSAEQGQPLSACEASCAQTYRAVPRCESQIDAFLRCADLRMASGWECSASGASQPKATSCPNETAALEACTSG
jgi:hypothetical protein